MSKASITMKEMLDAGVHFGHQTHRWNPKMKNYVFGIRGGIHIIDLQKSMAGAKKALDFIENMASKGGRLIFVGTKQQAIDPIKEAARSCDQYFIAKRWLGGTLTNFVTIKSSIDRYKKLERMKENGEWQLFSKKEQSKMDKELARHVEYLEGIKDMRGAPQALFVVDIVKEKNAVLEAKRLNIPVIAIADTNCNPEGIDFPIPGNDDAIRSIKLFSNAVAEAYKAGAKNYQAKLKDDSAKAPKEKVSKAKENTDEKKGPVVGTKPRLVAAGTAEDLEISQELDTQKDSADTPKEEN